MKNLDKNTVLYIIIAVAGLILMRICGPVFGTIAVTGAGGFLCSRTRQVYTYPLIALCVNLICSVVQVCQIRSSFDTVRDIAGFEWLFDMVADLSLWAVMFVLSIVLLIGNAIVFLIMLICNVVIKSKFSK